MMHPSKLPVWPAVLLLTACSGVDPSGAHRPGSGAQDDVGLGNGAPGSDGSSGGGNEGPSWDGPSGDGPGEAEFVPHCGLSDQTEHTPFSVRQSVEQLQVWHVDPETDVTLYAPDGSVALVAPSDEQGAFVFRELEPASGYEVEAFFDGELLRGGPFNVCTRGNSQPSPGFYTRQVLEPGFGYITTRDGTTLSAYVTLPGPVEDGPYPTVVNYSGYDPSMPGRVLDEGYCALLGDKYPVLCDAPSHPSGKLAGLMGYATVGVNMRGTGCSGGAYDFFETMQLLDGYDLIEVIAAQDWVKHHQVGMAGLSYPGLSQLWVAAENPPGLAAITPLSVIADVDDSTLAPGGIMNEGFALSWARHVLNGAVPYGKGWEQGRVDGGDVICEDNQLLHGQQVNVVEKAHAFPWYDEHVYAPLKPSMFVDRIDVPVFISGQWQDEQTGGHFPALFDRFTGTDVARFTAMNGVHQDGYAPHMLSEWKTFLDLYVDKTVPRKDPDLWPISPVFFEGFLGARIPLPEMRFEDFAEDDYEGARKSYEAEPPGRLAFEVGAPNDDGGAAGGNVAGAPVPRFNVNFTGWPMQGLEPERWYFGAGGTLSQNVPGVSAGASSFAFDEAIGGQKSLRSGVNNLIPDWAWEPVPADKALSFVSGALVRDTVMAGPASADLWVKSTAEDADLEVNITEVRADGEEIYVQSGWLRASYRALREDATDLRPIKSRLESENEPLTPGEWTEMRIEIFSFAHVFRAGSRIRITVETPGGNRPSWTFMLKPLAEGTRHTVGHSAARPSSVLLPVAPSIQVPKSAATLPPCPSLRAQPCRTYEPFVNTQDSDEVLGGAVTP